MGVHQRVKHPHHITPSTSSRNATQAVGSELLCVQTTYVIDGMCVHMLLYSLVDHGPLKGCHVY